MILVDMNQISVASVMMHLHLTKAPKVDEDMVRHMILNSLRMYRERFSSQFGELVICYDSKHYWRRDYFPQYKSNRKKTRDGSGHDWDAIFECLNNIKAELIEFFPYKVLEVEGAEADDIIAALCGELEFDNGTIQSYH
jgi:5'-3' exonuclease